jgi:hypothetical protein
VNKCEQPHLVEKIGATGRWAVEAWHLSSLVPVLTQRLSGAGEEGAESSRSLLVLSALSQ